ncbi:MAG: hypothetical protein JXA23_02925 [Bacteroidales bacterium]|nr:hypothetical protein [Bacteroidales bacterium]
MTEETLKPRKRHRGEAIWSIIWNLIFLFIVNKVPDWDLPFITDRYTMVLWIFNLNIIVQIAGWTLILLLDFRWVWHLVRAVLDAASLVVLLVLYFLYPFDFSMIGGASWLDIVLPVIFIIGMVVSGIGVVIHLIKLIFRRSPDSN